MKITFKLIAALLFTFAFIHTQAQKRNLDDTWFSLKNNEIEKAKESIDKAFEHESTRNSNKMFYYRTKVYLQIAHMIYLDSTKAYLDPNPEWKAAESLIGFFNSDGAPKRSDKDEILDNVSVTGSFLLNRAAKFIEAKDYKTALTYYDLLLSLFPYDSKETFKEQNLTPNKILMNMYLIANEVNRVDKAREYLNRMIANNYNDPSLYIFLARTYYAEKDSIRGIKVLEEGRKAFPDDKYILIEEINYYLQRGETDVLLVKFNEAVEAEPDNSQYLNYRGVLYHQKKLYDLAEKDYKRSLELNEVNYSSMYNLGILYVDMAAPIIDKMNANATNFSLYDKLESERNEMYQRALPYLEKAYESGFITDDKEEMQVVEMLRDIYRTKRNKQKLDYYQELLMKLKSK
jgi:tetratricopeptide (TPR) repeat protein